MTLDYAVLPIVAIIQASLAIHRLAPAVPFPVWASAFVTLITILNLRGIQTTARTNIGLLIVMAVVIATFFACSVLYLSADRGAAGLLSLRPFYDPDTFDVRAIASATSFAALTYIGFDGVTTLAEDVRNPTRNVPLATVSICLFTTIFSCVLVYFAQLIYPDYRSLPNIETAFMDASRRVGGERLFQGMGLVVILSSLGAALGGVVAAARVLLAMGRDNVLPRRLFGCIDQASGNPTRNILLISAIVWAGSLLLNLQHAGELLNFGALLGFMGVNLAALRQFYFLQERNRRRLLIDALVPTAGFIFCLTIWLTLPALAKLIGGAWLLLGISYYTLRTRRLSAREA
jgi:amino acid transporter